MVATANKIRISVDDGCASDVRLAELLTKYDIEGIFYWPVEWHTLAYNQGYDPLSLDDAFTIARKFEIGAHTISHRHLTRINYEEAKDEIFFSQLLLRRIFPKQKIIKFCPPRGYTTDELTEFTLRFFGSQRLTKGENLVHVHPDSGANDNKPWREAITDRTEELWCHSWELNRYNLWAELEGYLENINR